MEKEIKNQTNFELLTNIKNALAVYTNSSILRQAEKMIEELYSRARYDVKGGVEIHYFRGDESSTDVITRLAETHQKTDGPIKLDCRKGVIPSKENCFACPYDQHCKHVIS